MNDRGLATNWLDQVIGNDSNRAAADKAGIEQSSLLNRRKRGSITAEDVIAIARAYGHPVVEALVTTGFLTSDEAFESNMRSNLAEASDANLAAEILRRLQNGQAGPALTD
ncbi:hypothetical protein HQO42_14710 [Rhodococcus fascians]|nr:hypothetical protein [Rhodococcus fascians]MBY4237706.1 hypothetical protein [Rhodococcus fascians]MBY4253909.1 hypothetical protein [Rhodococcus fascians]MBY4269220.1 hypothetical protein [Rhodococcus fascians]